MANCSDVCISSDWYDDHNDFFRQQMRCAMKTYRCVECAERIHPGNRYEYSTGKTDDFIWDERTCEHCAAARDAFVCGSFVFGALWEMVESELFPVWEQSGPYDCLMKIDSKETRDFVTARYEEWRKERADAEQD